MALGGIDIFPAAGPIVRFTGKAGLHVIDQAALRAAASAADGALDAGRAARYLRGTAGDALARGDKVSLRGGDQLIPIGDAGFDLTPVIEGKGRLEIEAPELPTGRPSARFVRKAARDYFGKAELEAARRADPAFDAAGFLRGAVDEALDAGGTVTLKVSRRRRVEITDKGTPIDPAVIERGGELRIYRPHTQPPEQARVASALEKAQKYQQYEKVDFGELSPRTLARINEIRDRLGQEVLKDGRLIIPANVVKKLYEKRILNDHMTPDEVADLLYSIFHANKVKATAGRHRNIQALINARNELSHIGFIAMDPTSGETVVKSGHRVMTKGLPREILPQEER